MSERSAGSDGQESEPRCEPIRITKKIIRVRRLAPARSPTRSEILEAARQQLIVENEMLQQRTLKLEAALRKHIEDLESKVMSAARQRRIVLPPGSSLTRVMRFLLTPAACARYIEPVIADEQHLYIDALRTGNLGHARWIRVRMYYRVLRNWLPALLACAKKILLS